MAYLNLRVPQSPALRPSVPREVSNAVISESMCPPGRAARAAEPAEDEDDPDVGIEAAEDEAAFESAAAEDGDSETAAGAAAGATAAEDDPPPPHVRLLAFRPTSSGPGVSSTA